MSNNIKTKIYPNKFRTVYEKSPSNSVPISAIQLFVNFGSIHESDENHTRGIAHFLEHMTFKSTKKYPESKQIFNQFDNMGAKINAYTVKRYTCYTIEVQDEFITDALDILSEMMLHSQINPSHMKREEQVVLEENIKNIKDPDQILEDGKDSLLYQGTPYEYPVDNISYHKHAFQHNEILKWYSYIYQPHQMILSIVSNLSFSTLCTMIQNTDFVKIYTKINIPETLLDDSQQTRHRKQSKSPLLIYKPDLTTLFATLSFKVCSLTNPDRHALNFLKIILGGHFSSRMFMILREQHGLTYNSDVSTQYNEYGGDFSLCIECDDARFFTDNHGANRKIKSWSGGNKATQSLGVFPLLVKLLRDIQKKGNITPQEMEQNKSYIHGMLSLNMNSNETYTEHNGQQCLLYGMDKIVSYRDIYSTYYEPLTVDDIERVIKKYIHLDKMFITMVGTKLPNKTQIDFILS